MLDSSELLTVEQILIQWASPFRTRVQHVIHHTVDDITKATHGVFLKNTPILEVIDEAYIKAQTLGEVDGIVKIERERNRTIIYVNMGRDIGFVGGYAGTGIEGPRVQWIRLVLEDENIITAFPQKAP